MKQYELALDILSIKADLSIMTGHSDDTIYHNIIAVAKCLEAMGRMKDAAHMYHTLAETEPRIQSIDLLSTCYSSNAGTAYRCAENFDMAELMYIHTLHHRVTSWKDTSIPMNLYRLYLIIDEESPSERESRTEEVPMTSDYDHLGASRIIFGHDAKEF